MGYWITSHKQYRKEGLGKCNSRPVMYVLIQWTNKPIEEATWEIYGDLLERFPDFDSTP